MALSLIHFGATASSCSPLQSHWKTQKLSSSNIRKLVSNSFNR